MTQIPTSTSTGGLHKSAGPVREGAMRTAFVTAATCALLGLFGMLKLASAQRPHSYIPASGFVPDSATATRIAEAVLIPVYGQEQVAAERPLFCALSGGVWTCRGRLAAGKVGGVAEVQISKRDARILRMTHGR